MAGSKTQGYRHPGEESVQRPEIGLEPHVMKRDNTKKPDQSYPQNPSLATEAAKDVDPSRPPEFTWNEHPDRDFAEFLIDMAFRAAKVEGGGRSSLLCGGGRRRERRRSRLSPTPATVFNPCQVGS